HDGGRDDLLVVLRAEVPGRDGPPPRPPDALQHLRRPGDRAGVDEDHPPELPAEAARAGDRAGAGAAGRRGIVPRHPTKRCSATPAIEDVTLRIERGEVVGFLGPNGAGKTTTLRILAGVFPPTAGRASIDGCDVVGASLAARRRVGYAPERPALYLEMTVE